MSDFNSMFPNFLTAVKTLRETLMPIAFVLFVAGFVMSIQGAPRSVRGMILPLVKTIVLVLALVQLPEWGDKASVAANYTITDVLKVNPAAVYDQYNAKLKAQKSTGTNRSWWEKL